MNTTTPSPLDELKPCPFCGNTNIKLKDKSGHYSSQPCLTIKWQASCDRCCTDVTAPTKREVTHRWNTRHEATTPATDDAGLVKALETLIEEAQAVADDHHRPRYYRLDQALGSAKAAIAALPTARQGVDGPALRKDLGDALETASGDDWAWNESFKKEMVAALERSVVALDDWLHCYAGEFCDQKHVDETGERISAGGGTLAYIADVQAQNRAALAKARNEGGEQ